MSQTTDKDQTYTNLAAKLGDLHYKMHQAEIQIKILTKQIDQLVYEQNENNNQASNA
jgi:phage shock protein A